MLQGKPFQLANVLFAIFGLYMSVGLLIGYVKVAVAWSRSLWPLTPLSCTSEQFCFPTSSSSWARISSIGTLLYRRTGFKQTDWIVFNLILVSIECAVPVTLFTIGHMTTVITSPTTGIHQLFTWSQGANTLFVNLNARSKLRRGQGTTNNTSGAFDQPVNILSGMERGTTNRNGVRGPQVHIDVHREENYDMDPISIKLSDTEIYCTISTERSYNGKQNM
ncbi:hypothetical protein BDZ89DRAFT_1078405 [Hymenopellis radicata]|nr:hypothetical protein BDZ89DRAFT_1078405 [Hymenopellis radicata]